MSVLIPAVSDVLTVMALLNNENDYSSGGADESRAITALSMAQHEFDTIAASLPKVLQSTLNISTTQNQERSATNALTSALLRIDAIWFLDDITQLPVYKMKRIEEVGGHTPSLPWPLQITMSTGTGGPRGYYATLDQFHWMPLPDARHSARIYGYFEHVEFVDRNSLYLLPARCKNAIADFATRILNLSVGDDDGGIAQLGAEIFKPLLKSLTTFDRSEPSSREYQYEHTT